MQHTRVTLYDHVSGDFDELVAQTEAGLVQILRAEPGFLSYSAGRDAEGRVVSVNEWETHEQAEAALAKAATWIRENMADRLKLISAHVVDMSFSVTA